MYWNKKIRGFKKLNDVSTVPEHYSTNFLPNRASN